MLSEEFHWETLFLWEDISLGMLLSNQTVASLLLYNLPQWWHETSSWRWNSRIWHHLWLNGAWINIAFEPNRLPPDRFELYLVDIRARSCFMHCLVLSSKSVLSILAQLKLSSLDKMVLTEWLTEEAISPSLHTTLYDTVGLNYMHSHY